MKPLAGKRLTIDVAEPGALYAAGLLRDLGASVQAPALAQPRLSKQVARDWATSGLMFLTGWPHEPPTMGPGALPSCAEGAVLALQAVAARSLPADMRGGRLLSERAALLGLSRGGQVSPNGSCHLLPASDGWLALNLARDDDWTLLPALFEQAGRYACWAKVAAAVSQWQGAELVERARLMGIPAALVGRTKGRATPWMRVHWQHEAVASKRSSMRRRGVPLVVDLSSLWAGPLCSHLLLHLGARVVKVESVHRPDGARLASPAFYDLLNADKASVALDLQREAGRRQLQRLLLRADIVLEGSRPRALRQMGIDAEQVIAQNPALTWVSISGYGRAEPGADWVAFGDDAAVAAGAVAGCPPVFCGDALADPLTGIHAACAALAYWRAGGGVIVDLSLCDVVSHCLSFHRDATLEKLYQEADDWYLHGSEPRCRVQLPRARCAERRAAALGADTDNIVREFLLSC